MTPDNLTLPVALLGSAFMFITLAILVVRGR